MKNTFNLIANALESGRGTGKTYSMLSSAPPGTTVLVATKVDAVILLQQARKMGRTDLVFIVVTNDNLHGRVPPFPFISGSPVYTADHSSIAYWFREAAKEIDVLEAEVFKLKDRLAGRVARDLEIRAAKRKIKKAVNKL